MTAEADVATDTEENDSSSLGEGSVEDPPLAKLLLEAQSDEGVDRVFDQLYCLVYRRDDELTGTISTWLPCEAIAQVVSGIQTDTFDALLKWLSRPEIARQLHLGVTIALLRLPYPIRNKLQHWTTARDTVRDLLLSTGQDTEILLCGLYPK